MTEPDRFAHGDLAWQSAISTPLVRWSDGKDLFGLPTWFRGVVYRGVRDENERAPSNRGA